MKHTSLPLFLAISVFAACGGRVIEDPGSGGSGSDDLPSSGAAQTGTAGSPSARGSSDPLPSRPLGDCTPGFPRAQSPARPCNWLTEDGICFDDKDVACNCICPTDHDSQCISGFGGPGSATLVQCL